MLHTRQNKQHPSEPSAEGGSHKGSFFAGAAVQCKLTVGEPDDEYEKEADATAEKVMRMPDPAAPANRRTFPSPPPGIQRKQHPPPDELDEEILHRDTTGAGMLSRKCAACKEEEEVHRMTAHSGPEAAAGPTSASGSVPSGLQSYLSGLGASGTSLPESTKNFFEPRFGRSFSDVRIHTDVEAARSARSIDALAYTSGRNIVFNRGQYAPDSESGKKLLAHELTHVLQQGGETIRRFPYKTDPVDFSAADLVPVSTMSYWEQKTFDTFAAAFDARMNSDPEERDAVLSTFWSMNPPRTVTSPRVMLIQVDARTTQGKTSAGQPVTLTHDPLFYQVTLKPPAGRDTRPRIQFNFIASGAAAKVTPAPPATGFTPTAVSLTHMGFPGNRDPYHNYFVAHPGEFRDLFSFLTTTAPASFNQIVTTSTMRTPPRGGTPTVSHQSVFLVSGTHSGATITSLSLRLVSETDPGAVHTVAPDYQGHTGADLEIERLQAKPTAADRLGALNLPPHIPADEVLPLKFTIWQYFTAGKARNTEVDVIVPLLGGTRSILYTLTFGAHNDVTALRIGETGTGPGKVDISRIDVTRVSGFPGTTATPAALRTWWNNRYPKGGALRPTAVPANPAQQKAIVDSIIADMNARISADIANASWFKDNYDIEVLDAAGIKTRLEHLHHVPASLTRDTVNLDPTDLLMLELSLETLSGQELKILKGMKIGRKTGSIKASGRTFASASSKTAGLTLKADLSSPDASDTTSIFFASLYSNNKLLFRGSTATNALPDVTGTVTHELGHAVSYQQGTLAAFQAWLARHPQAALTWYAATSGGGEVFPEASMLYHTDPHFLCTRAPMFFAWFDQLTKTGTPPAATATLTAPGTCPP